MTEASGGPGLVVEVGAEPPRRSADLEPLRLQLEAILDSTEDGIFVLNRDEEVVVFNPACERLTGLRRADLGRRPRCDEVFRCHRFARRDETGRAAGIGGAAGPHRHLPLAPLESEPCALFDIFREGKDRVREELLLVSRTGERRWVETSFSRVLDDEGRVRYTVGVLRSIDDRKRAEEEIRRKNEALELALGELKERTRLLVHTEKMATLGRLAAGVAHELNTPLGTILGYSQLLQKQIGAAAARLGGDAATLLEGFLDELRAVEGATKRCRDIVQGLLNLSRTTDGPRAPCALAPVVERVFTFLRHDLERKGIAVDLDLDRGAGPVLADEHRIEQVLLNLAANAADAMPAGGHLSVALRGPAAGAAGGWVTLTVADTGTGIPPEVLPRIFEPFFTTKSFGKGTGIGLSIVDRIIADYGGTIEAASAPGAGATFTIRLPPCAAGGPTTGGRP